METQNLDYLLGIIETSRLSHGMKRDIAFMLLDEPSNLVDALADKIRLNEDSFEQLALSGLSSSRPLTAILKNKRILTYDEIIVKDAIQQRSSW